MENQDVIRLMKKFSLLLKIHSNNRIEEKEADEISEFFIPSLISNGWNGHTSLQYYAREIADDWKDKDIEK